MKAGEVIQKLRELKDAKKELEDQVSEIEKEIKFLEFEVGPQAFDLAGIEDKLPVKGFGTGTLVIDTKAYVRVENQPEWFGFLGEHGHGDVVKRSVHHTTQNKTVENLKAAGIVLPDYVNVTQREKINFRRSN